VVDGTAVLERDGRSDTDLASMPLLAGDRLRTQAGRVEVLFTDGSALHLDANTVVDFQSDEVVRLLEGRVRLNVAGQPRDLSYRIDAPAAWVQISTPGEYRISVLRSEEVELAVLRGSAELVNEQGRSYISAGERTFARAGTAPSAAYVFNSAAWDAFDRWSESRRDQRPGVSAQYLPDDVRRYAPAFESYGNWRYEQVYGYVWYPRVQMGWRPYHRGRWVSLRPYGWTWIAGDPWGWPTHHYGRWGLSAGSWFWIPGRRWAPAWVSWASAPGYVSWCPLGWNDRPIFQLNVNVYGGRRYDPFHGWSVLPRHHFNSGYVNVSRFASLRVDPQFRGRFVADLRGPDGHFAVNRSAIPIRTVGRYTGPHSVAGAGYARRDRDFPAAMRTPGTRVGRDDLGRSDTLNRNAGARAATRNGVSTQPPVGYPGTVIPDAPGRTRAADRGVVAPDHHRDDGAGRVRRSEGTPGLVSPVPDGAVRAIPRTRGVEIPDAYRRQERIRPQGSTPSYQPPATTAPAPPVYRSAPAMPRYERPESAGAPRDGGHGRSRSEAPRSSPAGDNRPVYRSAPERQAAPSRGESARPDRGSAGGGGRERSSESRSTGQATGRRR
jgi:uncharacterized cupin superfamily protein